jgi:hypothetical protein
MASTSPPMFPHTDRWIAKPEASMPGMLNVLTILTLINSAFGFAVAVLGFVLAPLTYRSAIDNQSRFDRLPELFRNLLGSNHIERARVALENRVPILLLSLVAMTLLLFGALQMRKLKRRGFYLYLLGDLVPVVNLIAFIKPNPFIWALVAFTATISLTFIILYSTQLKYMK